MADSGKFGTIQVNETEPAYDVRDWAFTGNANNQSYASNKTNGYTRSTSGVKSGTGSFNIYFNKYENAIGLEEGDLFLFKGIYDAAESKYIEMYARVDSINETCPIETGGIIGAAISFSSYGAWSRGKTITEPTPSGF